MRTLNLSLAVAVLAAASTVYAAGTTPPAPTPPPPAAHTATSPSTATVDYKARCTALEGEWQAAATTHATNASLGKAKSKAAKGKTSCASSKPDDHKKGVSYYEAALKLLGVTPE